MTSLENSFEKLKEAEVSEAANRHDKQDDGSLPQMFFPLGEDVVAGFAPARPLLGTAIRAHVLGCNQDRPTS